MEDKMTSRNAQERQAQKGVLVVNERDSAPADSKTQSRNIDVRREHKRLYLEEVIIDNLINYKGSNRISFAENGNILNDLFAIIGENNTGKTSLYNLVRTSTDSEFWRSNWAEVSIFGNEPERDRGTVACVLHERSANIQKHRHILGALFVRVGGRTTSVTFWLQPNGELYVRRSEDYVTRKHDWPSEEGEFSLETLTNICQYIDTGAENGVEVESSASPWESCKPYLPQVICYPNARKQVEEFWQGTDGEDEAEREEVKKLAEEILQKAGYEQYEILADSGSSNNESGITIMIRNKKVGSQFKLFDLPGGHQYLLNIALNIAIVRKSSKMLPSCLLADELTCQMHPVLAGQVAWLIRDCCRDYGIQVIMTTHSPHAVRALSLENIFRSRRLSDERTTVEKLSILKRHARTIEKKKLEEILFAPIVFVVEGESERRLMDALVKEMLWDRENVDKALPPTDEESPLRCTPDKTRHLLRNMLVVSATGRGNIRHLVELLRELEIPYFGLLNADAFIEEGWKAKDFASLSQEGQMVRLLDKLHIEAPYFEDVEAYEVSVETLERVCGVGELCSFKEEDLLARNVDDLAAGEERVSQVDAIAKKPQAEVEAIVKQNVDEITAAVREYLTENGRVSSRKELNRTCTAFKVFQDIIGTGEKIAALVNSVTEEIATSDTGRKISKCDMLALSDQLRKFEKDLKKSSSNEKRLKTAAKCRHLLYLWKRRAARTLEEKLEMLAEYLGEEMPRGGTDLDKVEHLFKKYLDTCQKLTRFYVWKHRAPGEMCTYDLESFTNGYGTKIGANTLLTEDEMKQLAKKIVRNQVDFSNDYAAFSEFLAAQVLPYFESHVSGKQLVEWPLLRPDLRVTGEPSADATQADAESAATLQVQLTVQRAHPALCGCERDRDVG